MKRLIGLGLVLALLALLALSVAGCGLVTQSPGAQQRAPNTACYFEPGGAKFVCGPGGTIEVQSGGALDVKSAATFGGLFTASAGASITVTNGAAFIPTAMYQPLSAADAVTPTITVPAAGKVVCVWNTSSNTITLADTGNQVLSGNAALGQYDFLCGYSDGTRFIRFTGSDN